MPSFTLTSPHVIILYGIEGIRPGKYALRDGVVSVIIEELNGGHILGGFY